MAICQVDVRIIVNICQVIAGYGEGGLEKHVLELSQQIIESGHTVRVLGDRRYLETVPGQIEKIPVRFNLNRRNPLLVFELLAKLRDCRCDVIHAQANKAASLVALLKPWLPCPVVGTLHNIKRKVGAFHKLDHVIAVSRQLAEPFAAERVSVIYNGIDAPVIEYIDLASMHALPSGLPVLCAAGRLVPAKGFDILLDAIDGLPVSLLIAGEGDARRVLEQRIARLSPVTHVRLLGHRHDVPSLMASAHAVVIASRREGFSYVCNEALLCGARLVSTNVPVANEILPPELLMPTNNAAALCARLIALLDDCVTWETLMRAPRQFAARNLTRKTMGARTCALYAEQVRDHAHVARNRKQVDGLTKL